MPTSFSTDLPLRGRILIVDDMMENVLVLNNILKEQHEVLFALKGDKAIELAQTRAPDLILLDAVMPEMDGYTVCSTLKHDPLTADIPIIFITALTDAQDETRALDIGAVDFISKPVNPSIVQARVRTHLTLKRQTDLLRRLTLSDGLTCIGNRRCFDEQYQREWSRCQRNQRPLSLMLIDIDHFKLYNDHYGHQAGDEALRRFGGLLNQTIQRSSDLAARYGGEEFAVLLSETDSEHALVVANKIHQALAEMAMPHLASPTANIITASIGLASLAPHADLAPESLLERADQALYRAKHSGRNRTEIG